MPSHLHPGTGKILKSILEYVLDKTKINQDVCSNKCLSSKIVNCNQSEYDNYMSAYKRRETKEKKLTTLQDEVSELKSDIGEIKNLLKSLLHGDNNAS